MPPNNSIAIGPGVAGRAPPQPPYRTPTFSSLFRAATGKKEKLPEFKTKEVFIAKYELEWDSLKEWLDMRFSQYKCTFTKRFDVVRLDLRYVRRHRSLI
jgi:hypothetical protein